ncbi:protein naked cuticle homolog [Anopheles aquasalis]|uniref:protein naked cuticle homolog n=1 Tax=Anopheles aquasalis TaxID=42839 RepID=UPI00215ACB60|nr:protein naked cuticle homolog [Anopheles aquasalis]
MAGNIVKWWKHKILGGYKQFTVLQECATDSEELIYQGRAPSACSAPPDLLLTSDREQMLKVKSSSVGSAGSGPTSKGGQHHHHHHHHQQQQQHHHGQTVVVGAGIPPHHHSASHHHQQQQHHSKAQKEVLRKCSGKTTVIGGSSGVATGGGAGATNTMNTTAATIRSDPDRVRLEEFTCDVSLEDGKKPQPLQFSFTLYDLDGHGKITKDDIAGIVSTIYESIGKSVVVPHYGSKTINVRLTVSPDGKTATKSAATVKKAIITPRRRYRPRKLISDDDGSDTSENVPRVLRNRTETAPHSTNNNNNSSSINNNNSSTTVTPPKNGQSGGQQQQHHHHHHHGSSSAAASKVKESNLSKAAALAAAAATAAATPNTTVTSDTATPSNAAANRSTGLSKSSESTLTMPAELPTYHNNLIAPKSALNNGKQQQQQQQQGHENVYESISNLKCCNLQQQQPQHQMHNATATGFNHSTASTAALICRECVSGAEEQGQRQAAGVPMPTTTVQTVVLTPSVAMTAAIVGAGRAKRKLVRKTRSSRKVVPSTAAKPGEDFGGRPRARSLSVGNENCYENVIGQVAQEECWKSSLCRRELIEIIRESMVKNSLCFQPNRKAMESSPKHRHRSHTIASRVGDQVFFNYHHPTAAALMAARGVEFGATGGGGGTATTTTTTALVTLAGGHETTNLCGYDSYLHQTICAAAANGVGTGAVHLATTHTAATAAISNGVASPLAASIPNRLLLQHSHHSKAKRKEHRMMLAAANPRTGTTHHATPVKLSTALLNQQYPNLSAEQKLTRSINQVEQWLDHRGPKPVSKGKLAEAEVRPLKRSKSKEELTVAGGKHQHTPAAGNFLTTDVLLENLKISEDMAEIAVVTPKKVYNKESLIASATKKNIKTHHRTIVEEKAAIAGVCPKVVQLQYGSIPINADPSECENLIRMSDEGEEETPVLLQSTSTPLRHHPHKQSQSQPQSPQHHSQQQQQQRFCGAGRAHSVSSASAASTTAVHRYVHEHIHHHYHHFENDPDES